MRAIKLLTAVYLMFTALGVVIWQVNQRSQAPVQWIEPMHVSVVDAQTPQMWFNTVRPQCNANEVEAAMVMTPPPVGDAGAAYAAVCWAVAGKVDAARTLMQALSGDRQAWAAGLLFGAIHGDADSGREAEVAPQMELVLEFQPDNVMALYHAGAAAYASNRSAAANDYLERFVRQYGPDDGWKGSARAMLESSTR